LEASFSYWVHLCISNGKSSGINIRHPHYTSVLIVGFGLAFFFYSLFALGIAIIAIPIMIWSILDEEKVLIKQYGEPYKDYMKRVPWRIIPRVF
jgi:protein-S-isoprenylcysteine O-methyltransferase Ste14